EPRPPFATIRSCLGRDVGGGPGGQGFALADALVEQVAQRCAEAPVLVLVDDLQWADPPSIAVLGRLSRMVDRLALLVVVAYRPTTPAEAFDALVSASDRDGTVRLTLDPLPETAVRALVGQLVGASPDAALLELVAGAGGNPRYVRELIAALIRAG